MSARIGRLIFIPILMVLAWVWSVPFAHAEFGPIQLVSKSAKAQADEAISPAISADARYVAFAGSLGGQEGVFRKDLQTGAVTTVANLASSELKEANPSISADGQYVAFTTSLALDPTDDTELNSTDVYVADMDAAPPTYELASAGNGSRKALTGGSTAAPRVALSADGRRVAFENEGEVYVRELGPTSEETILVSVKMGTADEPVPGGGAATQSNVSGATAVGAAISADGSTVAWVGRDLPEQVPMLADEKAAVEALEASPLEPPWEHEYHEPLWRRLPTPLEPDPPTRRAVGGGDPLAPGCPPDGTLADPACQGPVPNSVHEGRSVRLTELGGLGWGAETPQLSADGDEVAVVGDPEEGSDLFLVNMAPGLSRDQAVRQLTKWANPNPSAPPAEIAGILENKALQSGVGPIIECAISPDGSRIAFTTRRQYFPLASPSLVTPPPPGTSLVRELYQIDLEGGTIARVTPGGGAPVSLVGGDIETTSTVGAKAPSYSADGRFLSFASDAYNLVPGDTNEASDAFVVESPPPAPVNPSAISGRPATLVVQPLWRMTVDASSLPDGRVRVTVGLPGAGALRAKATARVGARLRKRRVAQHVVQAPGPGPRSIVLALPKKLRGLARQKGGLYAEVDVGFTGPGGKPLNAALDARFLVHGKNVKRKRAHR